MSEIAQPRGVSFPPPPVTRIPVNPADVYLESGYTLEPVVVGLTYPTSMTWDDAGVMYIGESGFSYGPGYADGLGRILALAPDGSICEVAGGFRAPMTCVKWMAGHLYVAEGAYPGRITRLSADGSRTVLVDGLRSGGDHYTGDIAFGPDDRMYFGVGTFTNSGVVGLDNLIEGWLPDIPQGHDVPARPYVLTGVNYVSADPFTLMRPRPSLACTGAFKPITAPSSPGETIPGSLYANGVIYSARLDGTDLRIVADGLRNPYGLGFSPDCLHLYALDQGYDERGSRQVEDAPDPLWDIIPGSWYGWPDYVAGIPVTDPRFQVSGQPRLKAVIACPPKVAGRPLLELPHHSAATRFDFSLNPNFGHPGEMFIAEYGGGGPPTGSDQEYTGFRVTRADLATRQVTDFLVNRRPVYGTTGPVRPVDVKFDPAGEALYVLDWGFLTGSMAGLIPWAQSGILWRVYPTC